MLSPFEIIEEVETVKIQLNLAMGMILATILAFAIIPSQVSAEQPAAEHYRQMFKSGNFYVEYQMFKEFDIPGWGHQKYGSNNIVLAGQNGKRMARETDVDRGLNFFGSGTSSVFSGRNDYSGYFRNSELATAYTEDYYRGNFGQQTAKKKEYPDVLYSDGKYYRFINSDIKGTTMFRGGLFGGGQKIIGIVLPEDQLDSPNLDMDDEWDFVREDLALPDELAIFYWDDPFRYNFLNMPAPRYNGESKVTFEDKEYACDQYLIDIKSLAGNVIAQEAYNMLYDNGQLKVIQKYLLHNGKEFLTRTTKISAITSDVPESAFKISKKINVYAAQNGNMADLLEQKTLVETLGGE